MLFFPQGFQKKLYLCNSFATIPKVANKYIELNAK